MDGRAQHGIAQGSAPGEDESETRMLLNWLDGLDLARGPDWADGGGREATACWAAVLDGECGVDGLGAAPALEVAPVLEPAPSAGDGLGMVRELTPPPSPPASPGRARKRPCLRPVALSALTSELPVLAIADGGAQPVGLQHGKRKLVVRFTF